MGSSTVGVRPNSPPQIDQRVVEHPALLEVLEERGDRPVALAGELAVAGLEVVVVVPGLAVAVPELDEADPALEQPPGRQELPGVDAGAVHLADRLRLLGDVERVGGLGLHPVRQLERLDARLELGLAAAAVEVPPVELGQQVELGALGLRADRAVPDVRDQLLDLGVLAVDVRALVDPGQERRLPVLRLGDREAARAHHDEAGQVLVLRPEPVEHPRADARPGLPRLAAVHQHQRRLVIGDVGVHRADHADVVDHLGGVREQVADLDAALAVLLELERRAHAPRRSCARWAGWSAPACRGTGRASAWGRRCRRATARRS